LPFGTALNTESTGETNRRFTSYDRSTTTKLDYAVNRHYDSQQGRFTQVDPIGMGSVSLASPQTLNLYAYCTNDPINHIDPSGLGFFSFLKKAFKWIGIAVSVALIVVGIGGLLLAAQLPAFLPLIGSTAGLASAITAASIGLLVTGALGLVSQVAGGKVGFIAGLALIGWGVFNFVGSLSRGNGLGFGFQDPVYNPGDIPGLTGPCPGGACLVSIFANYSAREMALWRALGHARDFFFGVFDNGIGPPPILGFNTTRFVRRELDSLARAPKVNEDSWSYYAGSWVPDVVAAGAGGGAAAEEGVSVRFLSYENAGGGGINFYRNGARRLALDWHGIKSLGQRKVLHWHWGLTKGQMRIHRGFFTGRRL